MNITIIGASRGIGAQVLQQALAQEHKVTVLARKPEKITAHENLQVVQGSFEEAEAVKKAVQEAEAVVVAVGVPPGRKEVNLFSHGTRNLLAACREMNSQLLIVAVTGIGAGESAGHGGFMYDRVFKPLLLQKMYKDKDRQEALLAQEYDNWIIVRPGFLTNGPQTGRYRVLTDLTGITAGKIARADVADFILKQIKAPTYLRQTPLLTY